MEGLIPFIAAAFILVPVYIIEWDDNIKRIGLKVFISIICILIGTIILMVSVDISTKKSLLDQPNPYHKEYVYHQKPDGTMVKVDSIYIKTNKHK
jgi:hypothetical protein